MVLLSDILVERLNSVQRSINGRDFTHCVVGLARLGIRCPSPAGPRSVHLLHGADDTTQQQHQQFMQRESSSFYSALPRVLSQMDASEVSTQQLLLLQLLYLTYLQRLIVADNPCSAVCALLRAGVQHAVGDGEDRNDVGLAAAEGAEGDRRRRRAHEQQHDAAVRREHHTRCVSHPSHPPHSHHAAAETSTTSSRSICFFLFVVCSMVSGLSNMHAQWQMLPRQLSMALTDTLHHTISVSASHTLFAFVD